MQKAFSVVADLRVYSLPVVHKAIYAISGIADVQVLAGDDQCVEVRLSALHQTSLALDVEFRRLLADFALQAVINAETADIRHALVQAAMSAALVRTR